MNVLLVNGSPHEIGCTYTALCEVRETLLKHGINADILHLGTKPVSDCIACGSCSKTGKCAFDDMVNETLLKLDNYDGFVFGSPVYYAGASGRLVSFMDRLFYSGAKKMSGKPAAAVVSCRRGGASAAFERINKYFLMSNMPVVPSQYWNQVHGSCPDDVLKDEEGLQTMRTLAQNMAYMLKCIKAGGESGIGRPEYEAKIRTSFIR